MRPGISPEPVILGFLLDKPVHGYNLYKQVNGRLGAAWRVSLSQLYAIVKTFESRGWIDSQVRAQETRPAQKVLRITPAGRRAFAEWLDQPARGLREFRVDFFLRLYFSRAGAPAAAARLIERQLRACKQELELLQSRSAAEGTDLGDLDEVIRSFRMQQLMGMTRWLEKHRAQLCLPLPAASAARKKRNIPRSGTRRPLAATPAKARDS